MAITKVSEAMREAPTSAEVSAHVTEFNDKDVRNDISTLALHSAIADNKAGYNLTNSFIDQFESDTGTHSSTFHHSDEYVSSSEIINNWYGGDDGVNTGTQLGIGGATGGLGTGGMSGLNETNLQGTVQNSYGAYFSGNDQWLYADMGSAKHIRKFRFHSYNTVARPRVMQWDYSDDNSSWTTITVSANALDAIDDSADYDNGGTESSNNDVWQGATWDTTVGAHRYWRMYQRSFYNNGNTNAGVDILQLHEESTTINATGDYVSVAQASNASVSKMGIILLYQDSTGTASLNTDLVCSLSADNGSNYSTATLEDGGTFSTGIKIAKANNVTIGTAGTQPRFKVNWANQASGSKITRLQGVALLY